MQMQKTIHKKLVLDKPESIILGGGCFWCLEAAFSKLKGVIKTTPGYAGGNLENPAYQQVCSGSTGHTEVIKVDYDSNVISISDLLEVFFSIHDPTTPNRQGSDLGTQYRSIILYKNNEQKEVAEQFIKELSENEIFSRPIVTEVKPLDTFYGAEEYHKDYYVKNPSQPYCQVVISPKIAKMREKFSHLTKNN